MWQRVFHDLLARLDGPLHLRFFMQPAMALFFGIRDGIKDAGQNRPAYLWTVYNNPEKRKEFLVEGLKRVMKILVFAVVLDAIYQLIEFHWFYPGEALIVAFVLAFVPYLIIRGPANRIAKWWLSRRASQPQGRAS
jgi:hypothetical protein